MIPSKKLNLVLLVGVASLMAACTGTVHGTGGGDRGGGAGTSVTIGGNVTGLEGTGLVLENNAADALTITGTGSVPFTFTTALTTGNTYAVTIKTQPSNPVQACTVTGGTGTAASTNVTNVAIACVTTPVSATIGGNVSNLAVGTSLILQDNGGDSLTITASGPFTFKTPVTGADIYAVTVLTQPVSPNQICTVANGSGTATANVTNVAVSCVLSYTIGGTVTGLIGNGLILQNSSTLEQLPISPANGNQAFTFKNLVPTGTVYTITIFAQPTGPVQTCTFTTGTNTGTATSNVTSVVVTCPAVTYSVGGTIVGLQGVLPNNGPLTDGTFILQNVLGNTLTITANGPFTFATPEALNDQYQISVLHSASTQPEGCTTWDYKGVVTANITNIVVDCGHDDWTWIDGTDIAGVAVPPAPQYGSFPSTAPATIPNPFTNTPGARYAAAGWTDQFGNLFLFGGDGWELSGNSAPNTLDAPMDDLWVCVMSFDYCQWQLVGGYDPTKEVVNTVNTTVGAQIIANAQNEAQSGFYPGTPIAPQARLGAGTWTDNGGNLWLFGGKSAGALFLNDLWEYNTAAFNGTNYTTTEGQWTQMAGSGAPDQLGTYTGPAGTLSPGARVNPASWTDSLGNLWLFGGFGYDGSGTIGYLNDLWEYTGGNWVWISGGTTNKANQKGAYGMAGTASLSNVPGGRHEAATWVDAHGNLWLFGGEGEDSVGTANGILNDLWMYNIGSNEWTYVMGSTTANQNGVYGSQPLIGPPNTTGAAGTVGLTGGTAGTLPGSRWGASGWTDGAGDFWLFGGWGLDSTATDGNGALNDLWVYTPNATAGQPGTWTWIKGSNTGSENGLYGDLDRPYLTYFVWTPGGRSNATHWVDGLGQLWLFGGEGYDSTSTTGNGYLNDMWRYLPYQD